MDKPSVNTFLSEINGEISALEENIKSLGSRLDFVSLQRKAQPAEEDKLAANIEVCKLSSELRSVLDRIQELNQEVFSIKECLDI
jgi:chromosome segregation ATPase